MRRGLGNLSVLSELRDDAAIEDRRRLLWVSEDLAAELLPDESDLDYLFPNAEGVKARIAIR